MAKTKVEFEIPEEVLDAKSKKIIGDLRRKVTNLEKKVAGLEFDKRNLLNKQTAVLSDYKKLEKIKSVIEDELELHSYDYYDYHSY